MDAVADIVFSVLLVASIEEAAGSVLTRLAGGELGGEVMMGSSVALIIELM